MAAAAARCELTSRKTNQPPAAAPRRAMTTTARKRCVFERRT
jgi:hypothetical protein